jgi:hypothetical protein
MIEIKQEKHRRKAAERQQRKRDREEALDMKNVPFRIAGGERDRIAALQSVGDYDDRTEYLMSLVLADEKRHLKTLTPEQRDEWRAGLAAMRDVSQNGDLTK